MGRARKEKVGQILELALQDYESVKTLSYSIRNMSVEEQAKDNFISVAYNEGQESSFANELGSDTFHQSNRNVATSRVANLLGIGGIVEQSSIVKVKEKSTGKITKGNLMTLAKGDSGASIAQGKVYEEMKKKEDIKERIEEAGNKFAPTTQKELTSLQVLDYICGHTDRHANNFFVEYDKIRSYTGRIGVCFRGSA